MAHSLEKQRQALSELQAATLAWWEGHRPVGWDLREHLNNPDVNTTSTRDRLLAQAVAAAVECGAL